MKTSAALREIRESSSEELNGRMQRLEEELFGHRMKRYTNQLDNTMKIREARREIARVKTVLAARLHGKESASPKTEQPKAEE